MHGRGTHVWEDDGERRDGVWNNNNLEYWIDETSPIQHFKPRENILDQYEENDLLRYGYIIAHPKAKAYGTIMIYKAISIFNKEIHLVRNIAKF